MQFAVNVVHYKLCIKPNSSVYIVSQCMYFIYLFSTNMYKVLPSHFLFQVAVCFWPLIQTVNFAYVPEKNRVVVVSVASFMWTTFLSYMHHLDQEQLPIFLRKDPSMDSKKIAPVEEPAPAANSEENVDGSEVLWQWK